MEKEIWKKIEGFGGNYEISSLGRVKSLYKGDGSILCQNLKENGYFEVSLSMNGKRTHKYIHRLVAEAFLKNNGESDVNHINEIKSDNRVENLQWISHKENINYGSCINKRSEKRYKPVIAIYPNGKIEVIKSIGHASKYLGINCDSIYKSLTNKIDSVKGFKFVYGSVYRLENEKV